MYKHHISAVFSFADHVILYLKQIYYLCHIRVRFWHQQKSIVHNTPHLNSTPLLFDQSKGQLF